MGAEVFMGMCGAPVMRNGKCIGMLTAKVHELSDCKELAGCAMCTYSTDIFEFLVEVEEQLKNGGEKMDDPTKFQRMREEEHLKLGTQQLTEDKPYRNWDLDQTRIAHRVQVPLSLFSQNNDPEFQTQEDANSVTMYGSSGVINEEVQENLGYHMNVDRDKHGKPDSIGAPPKEHVPGVNYMNEARKDPSPEATIHGRDIGVVNGRVVKEQLPEEMTKEWKEVLQMSIDKTGGNYNMMNNLRSSINSIHQSNVNEAMRESVFATGGSGDPGEAAFKGTKEKPSMENDIKYNTVDGKPIPEEFVRGANQYGQVKGMMRDQVRKGQRDVEPGAEAYQGFHEPQSAQPSPRQGREAATHNVKATVGTYESSSKQSATGKTPAQDDEELARRMARKAQRASERARKDAEHHESLRARHNERPPPATAGGDESLTNGLW
eukprot:GILI01027086.1.p1 GENE.GILI01027086.1~~GILI01027086.1.p1  ORF type:complete len:434 (+),score=64.14 GILI01027086.1:85-1386(+)